jgi:hypothetical protein
LVHKFSKEQGANILIPDQDLETMESNKVDIQEVQRRIIEKARLKEEKIRIMKQIQEEKELEGCTFAPQIVTKRKNPEKRDLNKFLDDQQKYLEMKQQKQINLQQKHLQNEQSVMNTQPAINEKSKRMLEKKKK